MKLPSVRHGAKPTSVVRTLRVAGIAGALLLAASTALLAHAVVYPKASTAGGRERYVIRVPNERDVATTRVEIQFPAVVRVGAFLDLPGWTLEVVRDSAKRITGAVWTGSLAPERFAEFTFTAVNPKEATEIRWAVLQTYADGEHADWTGPAGSTRPASITTLAAVPASPSGATPRIAYAALGLSLVAVGLALRRDAAPAAG